MNVIDVAPACAFTVVVPAAVPRVRVAVAMPLASVTDVAVTLPPPAVTVQVTVTPAWAALAASATFTAKSTGSVCPIVSVWALPPVIVST